MALRIAAETMQKNGLCRYDISGRNGACKHYHAPTDKDCVMCMEKGLLQKARKALKKGGKREVQILFQIEETKVPG